METIIGGAIAGSIGLALFFIQKYLSEKQERKAIAANLLAEVNENWQICGDLIHRKKNVFWWSRKFKTDAYNAFKGKMSFLPEDIRQTLFEMALVIEPINMNIDIERRNIERQLSEDYRPVTKHVKEPIDEEINHLKNLSLSCREKLAKYAK